MLIFLAILYILPIMITLAALAGFFFCVVRGAKPPTRKITFREGQRMLSADAPVARKPYVIGAIICLLVLAPAAWLWGTRIHAVVNLPRLVVEEGGNVTFAGNVYAHDGPVAFPPANELRLVGLEVYTSEESGVLMRALDALSDIYVPSRVYAHKDDPDMVLLFERGLMFEVVYRNIENEK